MPASAKNFSPLEFEGVRFKFISTQITIPCT